MSNAGDPSYVAPSDGWWDGNQPAARTEFSSLQPQGQGGDEVASGLNRDPQLDQQGGPYPGADGDEGPPADLPLCFCGLPSSRLVSRSDRNPNRAFFKCPKFRDDPAQCKYFVWEDELAGKSPVQPPAQRRRTGAPEPYAPPPAGGGGYGGPSAYGGNTGGGGGGGYGGYGGPPPQVDAGSGPYRPPSQPQTSAPGQYGSQQPGRTEGGPEGAARANAPCFKCGEEGHWARDCTAGGAQGQGQYGGAPPGGGGGGAGRGACFKCGSEGHWSRDCPNPGGGGGASGGNQYAGGAGYGSGGGGGYGGGGGGYGASAGGGYGAPAGGRGGGGGGGGGGRGACFKCGSEDHWSRDCPSAGAGGGSGGGRGGYSGGGSYAGTKRPYGGGGGGGYGGGGGTQGGGGGGACFHCGQSGHWSKDCPTKQ